MTLREKILILDLKPRNAPNGVDPATFGRWIRGVKEGKDIGAIPTAFLTLYCDGRVNSDGGLVSAGISYQEKTAEEKVEDFVGDKVEKMLIATVEEISEPKKEKKIKNPNPHIEERLIYEGPIKDDGGLDFIKSIYENQNPSDTVVHDMGDASIGDILPTYPIAERKGFSFGADRTMKIVAGIVKLNYNGSYYSILMKDAKDGFLVEGEKLTLADFKEVK